MTDSLQIRDVPVLDWRNLQYPDVVTTTDLGYCMALMLKDLSRGHFGIRFFERRYSHLEADVREALLSRASQIIIDETFPADPDVAAAAHMTDVSSLVDSLRQMDEEMQGQTDLKSKKLRLQIIGMLHKVISSRADFMQKLGKMTAHAPRPNDPMQHGSGKMPVFEYVDAEIISEEKNDDKPEA